MSRGNMNVRLAWLEKRGAAGGRESGEMMSWRR
jgi:hypothetical protein